MALDTNIYHPETGGTAVVTREAAEGIYAHKGWKIVSPKEAAEAERKLRAKAEEVAAADAEKANEQAAVELAASGVDPESVGVQAPSSDKGKK